MQTYSLKGIQSMLGLSRAVVSQLIAAGFVTPSRGRRREYRFTFQDVVLLRTAHGLQAAHIPARRIVRSLQRLRSQLPEQLPLTGLRITAVGNEVAVREGDQRWAAESGQLLFDFELVPPERGKTPSQRPIEVRSEPLPDDTARELFDRAARVESSAPAEAERLYREAIRLAPDVPDAYLNLGVMLIDSGRSAEAVRLLRQAVDRCAAEALLHYNLGVAHEELKQPAQALASYQKSLELSPRMADAHYNAARLHEALGHATQAIRHYSEYRRLQR